MGNCFNKPSEPFSKIVKDESLSPNMDPEKMNNLMALADKEKTTYSGHGGMPNLYSLAEEESTKRKSPQVNKAPSPTLENIEDLHSPISMHKEVPKTPPAKEESPHPFSPEDSSLLNSDKTKLVMIDEFSEEEVHSEEEEDKNNNSKLPVTERKAPIATGD